MITAAVLWRDCAHCGKPFVQDRRRGRPRVTCSDDCRTERGVHGDVRLTRNASRGTGVIVLAVSERHSTHDPVGAVLADLFGGDYEEGAQQEPLSMVTIRTQDKHGNPITPRWSTQERTPSVTDKAYGLSPAEDEGRTSTRDIRVTGQSYRHDWQEHPRPACLSCPVRVSVV